MGGQAHPRPAEELRRRRRGKAGRGWYVDETYIKVDGRWCYVYRAIDRSGVLVDVLFSERRDMKAARAFFRSAKAVTGMIPDRAPSTCWPKIAKVGCCRPYAAAPVISAQIAKACARAARNSVAVR